MKRQIKMPLTPLRLFSRGLLKVGFAFEIRDIHYLEGLEKPFILAGNHTGYLDSLIVLACVKQPFYFLMKEEIFSWGLIGKLVQYVNILPISIDKPRRSLSQALTLMKNGHAICIFPEGKLSVNGNTGHFNQGVAFLQDKSKLPLLPFAILGGFNAWPYGQKWPKFHKIIIQFGEPIWPNDTMSRLETTQLLKTRVEQLIEAHNKINRVFSGRFFKLKPLQTLTRCLRSLSLVVTKSSLESRNNV